MGVKRGAITALNGPCRGTCRSRRVRGESRPRRLSRRSVSGRIVCRDAAPPSRRLRLERCPALGFDPRDDGGDFGSGRNDGVTSVASSVGPSSCNPVGVPSLGEAEMGRRLVAGGRDGGSGVLGHAGSMPGNTRPAAQPLSATAGPCVRLDSRVPWSAADCPTQAEAGTVRGSVVLAQRYPASGLAPPTPEERRARVVGSERTTAVDRSPAALRLDASCTATTGCAGTQ